MPSCHNPHNLVFSVHFSRNYYCGCFAEAYLVLQANNLFKESGNIELAEKQFKEALQHWPYDPYTNTWYGELLMKAKDDAAEAYRFFQRATKAAGKFPDPYYFMGEISNNWGNFEEAEEMFLKVSSLWSGAGSWLLGLVSLP